MSVATNSDGDFAFLDLAGGEHVVVASGLPDEASGSVRVVPADPPSEVVVRCAAGSPVLFRLSAAGSRDAKPASWLRIVDSAGVVVDATDHVWTPKKRSFDEYSALLRDGRYTVVIGRVGFKEKTVEVDVPTRAAVDVALEPLPSGPR
jgi:hypothetical protein